MLKCLKLLETIKTVKTDVMSLHSQSQGTRSAPINRLKWMEEKKEAREEIQ